ncbi:MAG: hypothetical protein M1834_006811 [Cirrosporium novae-zelandiae]|nr:MAG: hypothetical protein M1834_006811 [Cirrosporium novae-zelandiae]
MSSFSQPLQRRRSSANREAVRPSRQTDNQSHSPESSASDDSQTVLISNVSVTSQLAEKSIPSKPLRSQLFLADNEPRKCWICLSNELEDGPLSSEWRSPCPCALTAHESCLLDWVADMERPGPRRQTSVPQRVYCPQCKSEIRIVRPRSMIVEAVNKIERAVGKIVWVSVPLTLAGTVWAGCFAYGLGTVLVVFGPDDARTLLKIEPWSRAGYEFSFSTVSRALGLASIPGVLVVSRTSFADIILPLVPPFFVATLPEYTNRQDNISLWPPSAAMTFVALPYMKLIYHGLYEMSFGKLERKWMAEIQPRAGQDGDNGDAEGNQANNNIDDHDMENEMGFELGLEVEIVQDAAAEENEENENPQGNVAAAAAGEAAAEANANGNGHHHEVHAAGNLQRQENIFVSGTRLADTITGALAFPGVSALMGLLLKYALPKSWTVSDSRDWWRYKNGLLSSRWGRTVVGGCLFVVLKDAVVLYCRWKQAQNFRRRRVEDYLGKRKGGGNTAKAL